MRITWQNSQAMTFCHPPPIISGETSFDLCVELEIDVMIVAHHLCDLFEWTATLPTKALDQKDPFWWGHLIRRGYNCRVVWERDINSISSIQQKKKKKKRKMIYGLHTKLEPQWHGGKTLFITNNPISSLYRPCYCCSILLLIEILLLVNWSAPHWMAISSAWYAAAA